MQLGAAIKVVTDYCNESFLTRDPGELIYAQRLVKLYKEVQYRYPPVLGWHIAGMLHHMIVCGS